MRRLILFVALLGAVMLTSFTSASVAGSSNKERAVILFDRPVQLLDVSLKGEYLFVHDDTAMARGEACSYVYRGIVESPDKLVISFHCLPELRAKARNFTVRTAESKSGIAELREFQFAGSTESHRVPIMID